MASIISAGTTSGTSLNLSGDTSGVLQLASNGSTTAVTINTAQKVGIGTTPSGSYILEVNGNPNFNSVGGVYLTCGTYDVIKNPSANIIAFGGVTSAQWDTTALYTGGTERMRINPAGQIAWGTSSIDGYLTLTWAGQTYVGFVMNNTDAVGTSTNIRFKNNGTTVGEIASTTTTTSYNTSSDYRLKENVAPMTGALAKVAQLKPVTYTWKATGETSQGFIAHELQEFAPYAVSGEKDGKEMQGVDYGKITPLLTAALQEALAKIESLEARLSALESK